jgi:hypothetical protein
MSIYGSELHKDGRNLFSKNDLQKEDWEAFSFVTKTNDKNEKEIVGLDVVYDEIIEDKYINEYTGTEVLYEIERVKKTLEMMKEDLQEYNDEDGKYLRFDIGKYYVGNYDLGENRNWIYEYEINEYYKIIVKKQNEYYTMVKVIEDEKEKIQMAKDVCFAVALALALYG